jgi:hypothetical protein
MILLLMTALASANDVASSGLLTLLLPLLLVFVVLALWYGALRRSRRGD